MSLFGAITISGTGIDAAQTWINTTAGNIANADDVSPTSSGAYATQTPVFTPIGVSGQLGDGVQVTDVVIGSNAGQIEYDPSNPLADAKGEVRASDVDTGAQLTRLIAAQEDYQANASAIQKATSAYQAALAIGK